MKRKILYAYVSTRDNSHSHVEPLSPVELDRVLRLLIRYIPYPSLTLFLHTRSNERYLRFVRQYPINNMEPLEKRTSERLKVSGKNMMPLETY